MVDSVNSVGTSDYFTKTDLPEKYDFNKDGQVDIADYNLAAGALAEDDVETYEGLTKDDLDTAFETVIEKVGSAADTEITTENASKTAQTIINDIKSGMLNPKNATTLNHLQEIGKTLTTYIQQCATLKETLATKIKDEKAELDEIAEKKAEKEAEYSGKEAEVKSKTEELSAKMVKALNESKRLTDSQRAKANTIISECVNNYKNGMYSGQSLTEIIASKLGQSGEGYKVSALRNLLKSNSELSQEIKSICNDIDTLVSDIRTISAEYNHKNDALNSDIDIRNQIIEISATASQQYESGYQQRIDMRKEIHDKYYVQGNGKVTAKNEQIQKLNDFLTNKELDNMPFADAWEILGTTFDNCGIKYGDDGSLKVPKGHDDTAKNVFAEFVATVKRLYTKTTISQYDEEEFQTGTTGGATQVTGVKRTDPISFTVGDVKYDFISDNNSNGVFDDATEFLGANNGWSEIKVFDTDGNGLISGDELKGLKVVSINQKNGQYTFMSADEAGIEEINLNSFKKVNNTEINNNITVGSFDIKMDDGSTIKGTQTEDTLKNLQNNYSNLFNSDIGDLSETYEANPFMEDFVERVDTDIVTANAEQEVKHSTQEAESIVSNTNQQINHKVITSSAQAVSEKRMADENEAKAQKIAEAKQKEEEEAEAEEAKQTEEAEKNKTKNK